MILIVSSPHDPHATAVLAALHARGAEARILDLGRYPQHGALEMRFGDQPRARRLTVDGADIDLDAVRAVWWRRPQPYGLDPAITDPDSRTFTLHEVHEAIEGLWLTLDATWVNDPARDTMAARKLWQLDVARACGLAVPRTLVTSDPEAARAFITAQGEGRTVYKPFQGSERTWRETRVLRPGEIDRIDAVRHAPIIFQEHVDGDDLRVTIVGDRLFPAWIKPKPGAYTVDMRMELGEARIETCALPEPVEAGLRRLMDRLGLVYGAVDLKRRADGGHVFLEVNPAGQWLFVEDQTGQPIAAALADALAAPAAAPRRHEAA
jgi:glutathione synthase/RimK-type ligase-like ATP-grasp enzyme